MNPHYDVLIIGAGLSGIGMACRLTRECPDKRFAILERRQAIGGTWDLFRYPGIRSDTDMCCFGFEFRPWDGLKVMGDGPVIREYVMDTAREYGIDRKINFGLKITQAAWSTETATWTVTALDEASGQEQRYTCSYLISCTGYYNYDQGYLPEFPGEARFKGLRIHPQHWPETLDYKGKRVVVIGSGATAVTLVPAMAQGGAQHVTMLQRSPSYIFSIPAYDQFSAVLRKLLPDRWVFDFARRRNLFFQRALYKAAKRWPQQVRAFLLNAVKRRLPKGYDMSHFTPRYMPWDERLCAVPDADLFKAISDGTASVVTDHIETFTETGIKLKSGKELAADIIITATGLNIQLFGGVDVTLDGHHGDVSKLMTYKGTLLQDVPNFGMIVGYTNAPWTLKADLSSKYLCRLFNHMDQKQLRIFTPRAPQGEMQDENILGSLGSGYIRRADTMLPRQGRDLPWRVLHDYERDRPMLLKEPIDDEQLEFVPAPATAGATKVSLAA